MNPFSYIMYITRYNDSPFGRKEDSFSNWGNGSSTKSSSAWDMDRFDSKQSSFIEDIPAKEPDDDRSVLYFWP